ncbi:MAG: hypothetical protein ACP5I3_02030 [Thermoproteus sp.]
MKLKFRNNNDGDPEIGLDGQLELGLADRDDREGDWALQLLKSLQRAPQEIVDKLDSELLGAVLREVAKSGGDAGAVARLALSLLERCGK